MTARRSAPPTPEATSAGEPAPPFEVALARLEEIVDQLEQGDLELEAALAAFEEGVKLSRQCAAQLDAAEQRVEVLVREAGDWAARPFEEPEDGSEPESGEEDD